MATHIITEKQDISSTGAGETIEATSLTAVPLNNWKAQKMTRDDFVAWHQRMGYTYDQGRIALGISEATYSDYLSGVSRTTGKPIKYKLILALACAALERGVPPGGKEI